MVRVRKEELFFALLFLVATTVSVFFIVRYLNFREDKKSSTKPITSPPIKGTTKPTSPPDNNNNNNNNAGDGSGINVGLLAGVIAGVVALIALGIFIRRQGRTIEEDLESPFINDFTQQGNEARSRQWEKEIKERDARRKARGKKPFMKTFPSLTELKKRAAKEKRSLEDMKMIANAESVLKRLKLSMQKYNKSGSEKAKEEVQLLITIANSAVANAEKLERVNLQKKKQVIDQANKMVERG